ncbi:MAG: hypothetical protein WCC90_14690 [Methylocella sp.]
MASRTTSVTNRLARATSFEEEPGAPLGLVNPSFEQACAGHVQTRWERPIWPIDRSHGRHEHVTPFQKVSPA